MPVPEVNAFDTWLEEGDDVACDTADTIARVLVAAAYWQGRCEGLEVATVYLKDRLDRIEAGVSSSQGDNR